MTGARVLALAATFAVLAGLLVFLVPTAREHPTDFERSRAVRGAQRDARVPPEDERGSASLSPSGTRIDASPSAAHEPALTFFVSEPGGAPVGNAVVAPRPPFVESAFSDASGRGAFAELPAGVAELAVSAPGFRESVVVRPAGNRLTVVLDRANELGVRLAVAGGTASAYAVRLDARLEFDDDRVWREHATQRPNARGEAKFSGVPADLPLKLFVVDALGALGEGHPIEPLGASETRVVDLFLTEPGRFVRGVVVDPSDRPIAAAEIVAVVAAGHSVRWKEHRSVGRTDDDGAFLIGPAFGSSVDLVIRKPGFAPHPAPKLALGDSLGPAFHFRLALGMSVVVSAETANGTPLAIQGHAGYPPYDGMVGVIQDDLDLGLAVESIDGALVLIHDVPTEGAKIVLRRRGGSHEQAVREGVDVVHFHVP